MLHFILLISSLVFFILGSVAISLIEARFNYMLSYPEISCIRNGVKWLRDHNQRKLYRCNILVLYLLTVLLKSVYLITIPDQYNRLELTFIVVCIVMIPAFIFPFIHDMVYYREYARLSNVSYENQVLDEQPDKVVIHANPSARISLLGLGLFLMFIEIYIIFA